MNSKRFIKLSLSLTLILLILVASLQIAIDPLFQYHKPWFGLKPIITNERYQNAGVEKNFDYDNVIIGNSLSENFRVSDVSEAFGGDTVKITASGSHPLDWSYFLDVLKKRKNTPQNILINMDPYIFNGSPTELKHDLPVYLYDDNYFNDVKYLFNFSAINDFTFDSINKNKSNKIPDYDSFMLWDDKFEYGHDFVLEHYKRSEMSNDTPDIEGYIDNIQSNLDLLLPYIKLMKDTKFVFFFSPFSMVFWDNQMRQKSVEMQKAGYLKTCEILTGYDNVTMYLWTDQEMLDIMADLDNYVDEAHYSPEVCRVMTKRIGKKEGILTKESYQQKIKEMFDYIESYDYNLLFE